MFETIKLWLSRNERYVIADPRDNSITFSKGLCKEIDLENLKEAKVFAFAFENADSKRAYGFTLNPKFDRETQLADVQYNVKHRCVGFEALNPTVNRIIYDYGIIEYDKPIKFSVARNYVKKSKMAYYEICRP